MAKAKIVGVKKGEKFDCPGCGKFRTYESGGLCATCRRKQLAEQKSAILPTGPVVKSSAEYADMDQDIKEHQIPNYTCPVCGKRYYAQGCNECPFCASEHIESLPSSFGKVTNADGEETTFGVDPLILMALHDAWCDAERKAMVALSGLSPISALARAHDFVQQIQRLGVNA